MTKCKRCAECERCRDCLECGDGVGVGFNAGDWFDFCCSAKQDKILEEIKQSGKQALYIIAVPQHHVAKIGKSIDVKKRWSRIISTWPEQPKISPMVLVPGAGELETRIHYIFRKYRTSGEWFRLNSKLYELARVYNETEDIEHALQCIQSPAQDYENSKESWYSENILSAGCNQ